MTMRDDIKFMIEAIMNSQVSEIENAVDSACNKVDEIFDNLEIVFDSAIYNLDDQDSIEPVKQDLKKAYDEI